MRSQNGRQLAFAAGQTQTPGRHRQARLGGRPGGRESERAFSLMELLVAIMILGLGMVMVATVFPVGMDISRDTIQMSISLTAADAAAATLALRLPAEQDLNNDAAIAPNPFGLPEVPDMYDALMEPVELGTFVRFFTEFTRWDGDAAVYGPVVEQVVNTAFAVRAWNLQAGVEPALGVHLPVAELSPHIDLGGGVPPVPHRVHVADRVYPPVPINAWYPPGMAVTTVGAGLYYADSGYCPTHYFDPSQCTPLGASVLDNSYRMSQVDLTAAAQAAGRRYAWSAFQHKLAPRAELRNFLATIVVTHRGELTENYAQQASLNNPVVPGLVVPPNIDDPGLPANVRQAIRLPRPAMRVSYDALFPVPWLAQLESLDARAGRAVCTAAVAELLPPGAMFVIAASPLQNGWPVLQAGTARKVLGNNWQPPDRVLRGDTSVLRQLEIARGNEEAVGPVLVWVFPPPIKRAGSSWAYGNRSPVVGVFVREVAP